ncbi:MAG: DNA-directed RNA polymerase subunit beta' [bacterium]|nr:DNA-directed RNA polymerase subunit beta' [bacterium]
MRDQFNALRISVASPERILEWSHGEVIKPETINYRTQRPEKDGLFSERIFGPTKDYECYCGKYRRIRYKGVVCDKCGVEVTRAVVRRERIGHITLAAPVSHIWFFKSSPSPLSLLLGVGASKLERVIYYVDYIVTSVDEENREKVLDDLGRELKSKLKVLETKDKKAKSALMESAGDVKDLIEQLRPGLVLKEDEYFSLSRRFANVFRAATGAEAIRDILSRMEIKKEIVKVEKEIANTKDPISEVKMLRRLKILRAMQEQGSRPEWLIMTTLPVLPPDLRPMVALDGGRYATSDLNDLYRRVINRNNRLKKLLEIKAPEIIVKNEKRMLQEAVDALIDNSARFGAQQMSSQRRPLRSLADMLKGKQGRFRQNLLGKRVDYSGRSVIVVGPKLKIDECGLPKKMALELFKPFVISQIISRGIAHNIRNANRVIEQGSDEVWAILEEVIKDRRVLLNRAPTLHRLSVQAFRPILVEGLAIQLPPLVCVAFNADFDGDQMAVHVPLSVEAQKEAREIMDAGKNLLKPATGDLITVLSQDAVLGLFYLTRKEEAKSGGAKKAYVSFDEAMMAYDMKVATYHEPVYIRGAGDTTIGRLIFNRALVGTHPYVNDTMTKKKLSKIVEAVVEEHGFDMARRVLDNLKLLGFEMSTKSGITWAIADLVIPPGKPEILRKGEEAVRLIHEQFHEGLLTEQERFVRVIGIWDKAKQEISKLVETILAPESPISQIVMSGARGSAAQLLQMMGMKGLVQNPKGETIELPIKASFKEGLSVLEYFISTHAARKGTTDTALKTAQAGYLTRRLVDVSQDLVIRDMDCRTKEGIELFRIDGAEFNQPFAGRVFSRTALEDIKAGNKILVRAGEIIDKKGAELVDASKLESIKVRSPLACKALYGLCAACYGYDLGSNKPVKMGEAVGVVAAQSIGEPGTQLTMRTFHIGGIAGLDITHGLPRIEELFEARPPKGKAMLADHEGVVSHIEEKGNTKTIVVTIAVGGKEEKTKSRKKKDSKTAEYTVPRSVLSFVKVGDEVHLGDQLTEGHLDLKECFQLRGVSSVTRYLINEVQKIYDAEGSSINNKHIEIIARQMFSRVKILDPGDATGLVMGEVIEKSRFMEVNRALKKKGATLAKAKQLLLGITRVALSTESFLSAASFQDTARVLVGAAVEGKIDKLRGLKENVIIGRLIPAGNEDEVPKTEAPVEEVSTDVAAAGGAEA